MSIKYKIRDVAYELDGERGSAKVYHDGHIYCFANAIEGWNYFTSRALWPMTENIRDELEKHGFNRHTGEKEDKP